MGYTMTKMNEEHNINFVLEVKKYPCLYDTTLSSYSRKTDTDQAWEEIGKVVNLPGPVCKEKWRNLRVVFIRHMKDAQSPGGKRRRPYYLLDYMQFITPYIKRVIKQGEKAEKVCSIMKTETLSDDQDEVPIEYFDMESAGSITEEYIEEDDSLSMPTTKRKKDETNNLDQEPSHSVTSKAPVISFLNSLVPELEEMDMKQFKIFKRKVLALIDDIMDSDANN